MVTAKGSKSTTSASANETPWALRFAAAFLGSYWTGMDQYIYNICIAQGISDDPAWGRNLRPQVSRAKVAEAFLKAYRYQYIVSGVQEERFGKILGGNPCQSRAVAIVCRCRKCAFAFD